MSRRLRPALLAVLATLTAGAASAAAQPGAGAPVPPSETRMFAPAPPALEVLGGDATVTAHVNERAGAIVACATNGPTTFVRARVRLTWSARGKIRSIAVSGGGAAFNRCAGKSLRGSLSAPVRRGGSGRISLAVRPGSYTPPPRPMPPRPVPLPAPAPTPSALQSCNASSDCTLHFTTHACVSSDPVAVNASADPAVVRKKFPIRHLACGMGGPQYDDLRDSNTNRYTPACEQSRCIVLDAGPQPTMRDRLRTGP